MLDKFAEDIGSGVIVVPLPPSVILAFGCRPGTSLRMHVVDGEIRVLPNTIPPAELVAKPNGSDQSTGIADSCWRWWKSQ